MIRVLRSLISATLMAVMLCGAVLPAIADGTVAGQTIIEDFTMQPQTRWRFFTDQVMGGISTGGVAVAQEDGTSFARMTGRVSTANRGGFIQMRLDLASPPPEGTTGVRLIVRGNDQRYFVHLRTGGTLLPWQYYQAGFDVTEGWNELRLPLDAFKASGALLRGVPNPASLTSVAVVAYGRDHDARIDVRELGFY
jgi:Complex I intermediate-associated protein 30 (CIA30)